jgi:hypothetical protein
MPATLSPLVAYAKKGFMMSEDPLVATAAVGRLEKRMPGRGLRIELGCIASPKLDPTSGIVPKPAP